MNSKYHFEIKEELGEIGNKKLRVGTWGGNDCKLDFRNWWTDASGAEMPGKGVTMSIEEAKELVELVQAYIARQD